MKKKTIKINFKYFWKNFNQKDNFLTNLLRKKYNVEISDKPDYLFYSVYPETFPRKDLSKKGNFIRSISPELYIFLRKIYTKLNQNKNKVDVPEGDFVKILFAAEDTKPNMKECDWAFSSRTEEEVNHPKHMNLPVYIFCSHSLKNFGIPNLRRKININKIKKEKTKFCNFLYSQEILKRNDFFKRLSKYKKIDSPGRCMNNIPQISNSSPRDSRVSPDWVKTKLDFIKKYKFTIAFENNKNSYTTEKLTHPLLVNSIPIYFGNKNVGKDFNTKSFINYNDFKNMKEFIEHIIKVDQDDNLYKEYLKQPIYLTKETYEFNRIDRIEKRLKEIIESKNGK